MRSARTDLRDTPPLSQDRPEGPLCPLAAVGRAHLNNCLSQREHLSHLFPAFCGGLASKARLLSSFVFTLGTRPQGERGFRDLIQALFTWLICRTEAKYQPWVIKGSKWGASGWLLSEHHSPGQGFEPRSLIQQTCTATGLGFVCLVLNFVFCNKHVSSSRVNLLSQGSLALSEVGSSVSWSCL